MPTGGHRMIPLGYGKHVRSDRIVLLEPLAGDDRQHGARTRVWIEGVPAPVVASRTERAILDDMAAPSPARRRRARSTVQRAPALFDDAS